MEQLRQRSNERVNRISLDYIRDEMDQFDWSLRLMGIKGARGIGKTTLLLQYIRQHHGLSQSAIFLSLDDIYFTENRLLKVITQFHREGGKFLYVDEVHKYPDWAIELKNAYDTFPDLQIVFTGSSILEILKANVDLSRRAIIYRMQGLSFRQSLALERGLQFPPTNLIDILKQPNEIIASLPDDFHPYAFFHEYLKTGYFPFFMEGKEWYFDRINAIIKAVIETDLAKAQNIDIRSIRKLTQLLYVISGSPPFKPNITRLSERTQITRGTLVRYLYYLEQADLINLLDPPGKGTGILQKPEKIFMENTNLMYAFHPIATNIGAARETFVLNQLKPKHEVHIPSKGDFLVDETYTFEVGGKSKGSRKIKGLEDAYIIADDLDFAVGNKIPIWLFGFLN